jgi:hypothetical protein
VARSRFVPVLFVLAAALAGSSSAFACGNGGYSYAGLSAPARAFGIGATVTPLASFAVASGHIAGWVGVGGPNQGPGGADEWLQVGFNTIGGIGGPNLYFEVTRAGGQPTYHQIAANLPSGRSARVAVLEMHARPNWWRVWVNGAAASDPIQLPGSHGRWAPIATAEAWDGGGGQCNQFLYRFHRISLAHAPGGGWKPLTGASPITSPTVRMSRSSATASFLAAQGEEALRSLASFSP